MNSDDSWSFRSNLGPYPRISQQRRGGEHRNTVNAFQPLQPQYDRPYTRGTGSQGSTQYDMTGFYDSPSFEYSPFNNLAIGDSQETHLEFDEESASSDEDTPLVVTSNNIAAVLKLDCALYTLQNLLDVYRPFDKKCRHMLPGWKDFASKHFDRIREAIALIHLSKQGVMLKSSEDQGCLVSVAQRIELIESTGKSYYLKDDEGKFLRKLDFKLKVWRDKGKHEVEGLKNAFHKEWEKAAKMPKKELVKLWGQQENFF